MRHPAFRKHFLTLRVLPLVACAVFAKAIWIWFGWDGMPLNALIGAVISAGVFLLGFLISGLLPDYKEAERIPGEISAVLDTLADEALIIWKRKTDPSAKIFLASLESLAQMIHEWFHKKIRTRTVMDALRTLNDSFAAFEDVTQPNFITRMKQEQSHLRRMIIRVHTIRETTFIATAYAIAESFTLFIIIMLLFVRMGDLSQSLLLMGMFTFLLTYMIGLIKDLDNPFHYHENRHMDDEIALEPLRIVKERLQQELKEELPLIG